MHAAPTLIVTALARREGAVLLVEQHGPDDERAHWMLPGGRVERGEAPLAALARELAEETGLRLHGDPALAFVVDVTAPDERYSCTTFDCEVDGELRPDDPDGLVVDAAWVDEADALIRLAQVSWYDASHVAAYLDGSAPAGARHEIQRT